MIYLGYGSNCHMEQMARRCPAAIPLGWKRLKGQRLVFRGVADCIPDKDAEVYVSVWRITEACERALDIYEGCHPDGSGMYWKDYLPIRTPQGDERALIYRMNSEGMMPPTAYYLGVIEQGYRDFRMPARAWKILCAAQRDSWDDKAPSNIERQRHRRNGRPALCRYPAQRPAVIAATAK